MRDRLNILVQTYFILSQGKNLIHVTGRSFKLNVKNFPKLINTVMWTDEWPPGRGVVEGFSAEMCGVVI